ncbi:MAG: type IX secretion system sortase PorU [Bacteroidota bacterium]
MKLRLIAVFAFISVCCSYSLHAQKISIVTDNDRYTEYVFENDSLHVLPPYDIHVEAQASEVRYEILEQAVSSLTLPKDRVEPVIREWLPENARLPLIQLGTESLYQAAPSTPLSIHFIRENEDVYLVTRKLRIRVFKSRPVSKSLLAQKPSALQTPLASGTWYKIPVNNTSVYRLTATYLDELGVDVNSIDPRNIQLWGTDGYELNELNSEARPDFVQIPVSVTGQDDGQFDSNDEILFFGSSPHQVLRNNQEFIHEIHPYTNTRYVYLTIGSEPGLRWQSSSSSNPARDITSFTDFVWLDEELTKTEEQRLKSGRYWLGQIIPASANNQIRSVFTDTLPGIIPGSTISFESRLVARSEERSFADGLYNGTQFSTLSFSRLSRGYNSEEGASGIARTMTGSFTAQNSDIVNIDLRYRHSESSSRLFVDWIRLEIQRELIAENGKLFFFTPEGGDPLQNSRYVLQGFDSEPVVLDVTDPLVPVRLSGSLSQGTVSVIHTSAQRRQLIVQQAPDVPEMGTLVLTQNLRGVRTYPDYVVVTAPIFLEYAEDLASFRTTQDNLTPLVVTQEQIFNEFSGGSPDPTAIRDFVKYLRDVALADGQRLPAYLLLFGDATFDYKNIVPGAYTNYVFTHQSVESLSRTGSYGTDDFFGYLDTNEGILTNTSRIGSMDIGIGRISSQTRSEAATLVQKIKDYELNQDGGDWQNLFTFSADDDLPGNSDRDLHMLNADGTANIIGVNEPGIRLNKIYLFDYPSEVTGSGRQVPGATQDLLNSINEGTLVTNYSGHGNEQTLADENLFLAESIPLLTNRDRLTIFVTATCQFGRYDDIDAQSGAEELVFSPTGGGIAALTTTRVVYTSASPTALNFGLNIAITREMTIREDDAPKRLGDIFRETKRAQVGKSINSQKFILIGDPAIKFRLPTYRAQITSLNENTDFDDDTTFVFRALDSINLTGEVRNFDDELLPDFNGEVVVTVFDGKRTVQLPPRPWVIADNCFTANCNYEDESDILFRGRALAQNGLFNASFIVPRDITFASDNGRVVFFAENGQQRAGGSFANIRFNGINTELENDGAGPNMDIYLNDNRFVNGTLVGSSPMLIVELNDQTGINTTGTGVGHEITATIDTNPEQTFVLNTFYEANLNDFTGGRIEYPLENIPEGNYTLRVRAWDVHNNPSEQQIAFEVANSDELVVDNVYNYPNPMTNATAFTFEHNQQGNEVEVSIRIFTLSGRPVQHIKESLITTSSYASIPWNGRDRDHDRLGNGTYVYVLRVTANTPKGRTTTEKIEKLVIIR